MRTSQCGYSESVGALAGLVHERPEPVMVSGEGYSPLVALSPALFEYLLFGTAALEDLNRSSLHL